MKGLLNVRPVVLQRVIGNVVKNIVFAGVEISVRCVFVVCRCVVDKSSVTLLTFFCFCSLKSAKRSLRRVSCFGWC